MYTFILINTFVFGIMNLDEVVYTSWAACLSAQIWHHRCV